MFYRIINVNQNIKRYGYKKIIKKNPPLANQRRTKCRKANKKGGGFALSATDVRYIGRLNDTNI